MRRFLVLNALGAGIAAVLATAGAAPASANSGPTTVSFDVTAGTLSITAPTGATLTGSPLTLTGTSVSGSLGNTTVSDARGMLAGWTVTVSGPVSPGFTSGVNAIDDSAASIWVPALPAPTITGAVLPVFACLAQGSCPLSATTAVTLVTAAAVLSPDSVTYTPMMAVTIPATAVPGTYTGVVTQTVS